MPKTKSGKPRGNESAAWSPRGICFETTDSTTSRQPASFLIGEKRVRDAEPQAARLGTQFLEQNRGILRQFGVTGNLAYDGSRVDLVFQTSTNVGAIPLLSPTTGRPDYGLIIQPRFGWQGIGPMMGATGWRVLPAPLRLPLLPHTDQRIPPWVLSTIVLFRLKALLDRLKRRFEFTEADLPAPRGTVRWAEYCAARLPAARFLNVPCRFPDLRDDQELKAAIHFTLRRQLMSLEGQRHAGPVVHRLIDLCTGLIQKVRHVPASPPTVLRMQSWLRAPMRPEVFREGLQAVEWTIEETGLAGLADLQGLPWMMSMEAFFESWIETLCEHLTRRIGGQLKVGRKRETVCPIIWDPPYTGSQKSLVPDLVIDRGDQTIIIDAKFKGHWEELQVDRWNSLEDLVREQHRHDLLQVLAYANSAGDKAVTACLVYPCRQSTWQSLIRRGRTNHRASLRAGTRRVNLVLMAVPMTASLEEVVATLQEAIYPENMNYDR